MRLFVILFVLAGCASTSTAGSPCVIMMNGICHCKNQSNKTVWLGKGVPVQEYIKACR